MTGEQQFKGAGQGKLYLTQQKQKTKTKQKKEKSQFSKIDFKQMYMSIKKKEEGKNSYQINIHINNSIFM